MITVIKKSSLLFRALYKEVTASVCTFCRFRYSFIAAMDLSRSGLEDADDVGVDNDDDDDDGSGGCDDSDDDDEDGDCTTIGPPIIRPFLDLLPLPPDVLELSKSPAL